ncbi:MAG TPA: 1,4-dihydroxy-2-naphthoate polyprenyltransferase [Thermoanaerobaculia bacterium]|jgi:1,4-dihydroxy-2-naphthoate octaprenyltransferase
MNPWVLAARPKTLAAAIVPVLVGFSLARFAHWPSFWLALGGAVFIQIGTNYVNDALDFRKGADTHERLGPLRVTQAGLLTADAVLRGAAVCFAVAAICGVPLIVRGGWPIIVIGLASMAAAYAYTGGPYPLAYHGLGELFVMVFFGTVAVSGTYYLQVLRFDRRAILAGLACGALAIVLLAINNLRDIDNDRASNKRTLAARFGRGFARVEIVVMALLPFALAALIGSLGVLFVLPLALLVIVCALRSEGRALNRCLAFAGMLEWAFGIAFVVCGSGATR